MSEPKPTWGGRRAGAGSGGPRPGAGRPRSRFTAPPGSVYIMERKTVGGEIRPPELWTVLSVSETEIEFQYGDDIIVLRRPDEEGDPTAANPDSCVPPPCATA